MQWTSCNTLPHCLGAVGSGPPPIQCVSAWGQWAVDLLQYTASLPGGSGQWTSCNTASLPRGSGQWTSCNTLPHCLGVVGSGPPAIHCPTAWGQWAVGLPQYTASLPGAVGCGPPAIHCFTAWGQCAVDLLQYTAPLPGGSGEWTSAHTLPHCLGAVGSGPTAIHCLTAWGQWAMDLLQYCLTA